MLSKINTFLNLFLGRNIPLRDFNSMVKSLAIRDLHLLYEYALKKMDPTLEVCYSKYTGIKKFIFTGRGLGTLKPYRVLKKRNQKIFEKVFYSKSDDLKANLYFYENKNELLKSTNIKVPQCLEIIRGKLFTVVRYEYLNLKSILKNKEYEILKAKTLELYRSSSDRDMADPITFDVCILGKKRLLESKALSALEISKMDQLINKAPVFFQHLDLSGNNVYQDHQVIDWDNSGYFPLGMDFGRLLLSSFILHENKFYNNYEKEIAGYFRELRHQIPYNDFRQLTMYFFLVFYYGHFSSQVHAMKVPPLYFIKAFKDSLRSSIDDE